jgi:methionyl-tRNA formyltransferase
MSTELKLAFAGTPELAATILRKLIEADAYAITCVYTQADKPAGRGRKLHKSAVKEVAESKHLVLKQPARSTDIDADNELGHVDILIVAAYGMLLPETILNRPRLGCINVHTSLLPRWRGAAPIQRAIQAGDKETGISIMQMDTGLDTGHILLQKACPIASKETAGSLHDRLAILGGEALIESLSGLINNTLQGQAQDNEHATYAHKISKAEADIDWTLPAELIERTIRAYNPFPIAHTVLNGTQMRVWQAEVLDTDSNNKSPGTVLASSNNGIDVATANGVIRIQTLQLPGKKMVTAAAFHNGHPHFSSAG